MKTVTLLFLCLGIFQVSLHGEEPVVVTFDESDFRFSANARWLILEGKKEYVCIPTHSIRKIVYEKKDDDAIITYFSDRYEVIRIHFGTISGERRFEAFLGKIASSFRSKEH